MSRIIVATRTYELDGQSEVIVEIYKPEVDQSDYICEFCITGLSKKKESYAVGSDGVQALYLALQKVATMLYCSKEFAEKRLTWFGDFDLGLPYVETIR